MEDKRSTFTFFDAETVCMIGCDASEAACVHLAVADLAGDVRKLSGRHSLVRKIAACFEAPTLIVGTAGNPRFEAFAEANGIRLNGIRGEWERFSIQAVGPEGRHLCVAGSDPRGTMWGIYEICEKFLGVDPMYLWTDHEPSAQAECVAEYQDFTSPAPVFRFRGWFLNDEDLLSEWKTGGGSRNIDYRFYGEVIHPEVLREVIETALRLRQNLIIPASFIDIMNPAEEELVRAVTERGLFISQHHVEPLGVSHFAWTNYWKERGEVPEPSFVAHPEHFEAIWTDYVRRWNQYGNVIWQLGLRGKADQPVWDADKRVPPSMEERGALISRAMRMQKQIVERERKGDPAHFSSTLWLEGASLHREGFLEFPEDTIVVFADEGMTQMMERDFHEVERLPHLRYGVYTHVACWGCGPHLAQGTSLRKIHHNYQQIIARGDTAYSVLNVSNIRELVLGIRAVGEVTLRGTGFEPDSFLAQWCREQFGQECAPDAAALYEDFFAAYFVRESAELPDEHLLLDGMAKMVGTQARHILCGIVWQPTVEFQKRILNIGSEDEFLDYYFRGTAEGLERLYSLHGRLLDLLPRMPADRKSFFTANLLVQTKILIGLYEHAHFMCAAALSRRARADSGSWRLHAARAVHGLENAMDACRQASRGKWRHWYRGDKKLGLRGFRDASRDCIREEINNSMENQTTS